MKELGSTARASVQSLSESCQTWTWFQVRTPNAMTTPVAIPASPHVAGAPVVELVERRQQDNRPAPARIAHPRAAR